MVLCRYFVNGNCRFDTKCENTHLDIKQTFKSDVESAIKGNQWPLSCFGPFKEKPNIPNFVEDQSFEEIRWLCYSSKKFNFFENFNAQFSKEVLEAKNKMKRLLNINHEITKMLIDLYNTDTSSSSTNRSNPFGSTGGTQPSTNVFTSQNKTAGNPFSSHVEADSSSSSLFGNSSKSAIGQNPFKSFATPQPQPQGNTIFGQVQQQPQSNTNAFGGNVFAQPVQQMGASSGQMFGGTQQSQFGSFSQPTNTGNVFAQAMAQPPQPALSGGSIFAQAAQSSQSQGFGMYLQPMQQPVSAFPGQPLGQQSAFGGVQPVQPQQQMLFSQNPVMQQQPQNTGNLFTQQTGAIQQPFQGQQGIPGGFGGMNTSSMAQNVQQQSSNIFAQAAATHKQALGGANTYSRMEDLKPEDIEAFKAPTFDLGKIPLQPPPIELVNIN